MSIKINTSIKDFVYFFVLLSLLFLLFMIFKLLGFSDNHSKGLSLLFLLILSGSFIFGVDRYIRRRSRKEEENWSKRHESLSLDEKINNLQERAKEFDRLIEEQIEKGYFTRQDWEEAKHAASNLAQLPEYSSESIKTRFIQRKQDVNIGILILKVILFILALLAITVVLNTFLEITIGN
ncbi:MAG: hypothetical protein ACYDGO_06595 [Smithellaceae bacterium]